MRHVNEAKRRLLLNVTSNVTSVGVTVIIGFWLTRYLIKHLGVAAYGIIPLVTQVIGYFTLFSMVIKDSLGRFVIMYVSRKEYDQSNIYFNTTFYSVLMLCLLLCIPVLLIAVYLPAIFRVPQGHESDSRLLFLLVALSSFMAMVFGPFHVGALVKHRFDMLSAVQMLSKVFRVGLLVLCFSLAGVSLKYVGWSYFGMGLFLSAGSLWLFRHLMPELHVNWRLFRLSAFREIATMSLWMTVNQVGALLYLSSSLIIINIFMGPEQGGLYGPFVLLVSLLNMAGAAVANVFTPIAYENISLDKHDALVRYTKRSTKFIGLIGALPVGLMCGLSGPLLHVWLGPSFSELSFLMYLLIGPWVVNVSVRPQFAVYKGMNKVKIPAIIVLIGGMANVLMAVLLVKFTGMALGGVALASAVCLTAKNFVFTPVYTAAVLCRPRFTFLVDILPSVIVATLLSAAGVGLSRMYELNSILPLLFTAAVLSIGYILVCYFIVMNAEDKRFLRSLLKRRKEPKLVSEFQAGEDP